MKKVVIFGSSSPSEGDEEYESAVEVGRLIAGMGFMVVNGGFTGTMEASSKGAKSAGGKTLGVTSKTLHYAPPNKFNDKIMEMPDMFNRIKAMVEMADAFVVLKGSTGTLAELMHAWDHINNDQSKAPVICFGPYWKQVTEYVFNDRKSIPLKDLKFVNSLEELKETLTFI